MSKEIYNEGRVVGLSAYEIYIRQFLEANPTDQPSSEREWLASSLALGVSMLIKFPAVSQEEFSQKVVDIPLPANSRLCAANTIIASFFNGNAELIPNSVFAKKVTDYGELISNTSTSSPTGSISQSNITTTTIPTKPNILWTSTTTAKLKNYTKIISGLILQPGTWTNNSSKPPEKDFEVDISQPPVLRFHVVGNISEDSRPFVLLTGFALRPVVQGESGLDTSLNTNSPQDGDFLGPATFPWANKIILSVPTSALKYIKAVDLSVANKGDSTEKLYYLNIKTPDEDFNAISLSNENGHDLNLDGALGTVPDPVPNTVPVLNWHTLLRALGENKKINAVGNYLNQISNDCTSLDGDKQYAIKKVSNQIKLEEINTPEPIFPNFFIYNFVLDPTNNLTESNVTNVWESIVLNIFGFSIPSSSGTTNTIGAISVANPTDINVGGNKSWYQKFRVKASEQAKFDDFIQDLLKSCNESSCSVPVPKTSPEYPKILKINCYSVIGYTATGENYGAPRGTPEVPMNSWTMYINTKSGTSAEGQEYDGIIYVKNATGTTSVAASSILCTCIPYSPSNRPHCRRPAQSDKPFWTPQ